MPWAVLLCALALLWASACALERTGLGGSVADASAPVDADPTIDADPIADAEIVDSSSSDAPDAPSLIDAGPDAGPVDLLRFGTPTLVEELSSPDDDDDPSLTDDLLEIFFNSDRGGTADIYTSQRAAVDAPWDPPTRVAELSSPDFDTTPFIAGGGQTIWLASERNGGGNEIFVSTRTTRTSAWTTPRLLPALNSSSSDASPATRDRLRMVFDSDRGGTFDMYESVRSTVGDSWRAPTLLRGLATDDHNVNPVLGPTGLRLWYASDRSGSDGVDLWATSRDTLAGRFGVPTNVAEVNSSDNEDDPWISNDLHQLYFASDRDGSSDIYVAVR